MGIEIPDSLQWVAKYILGAGDWPDGDETAMRRLADAWTSTANTLDTVDEDAARTLTATLSALSEGETHDAIAAYRDKLLAGDEAAFTAIRKWCEKQAELLEDGANDIEHTKLVIIGTMIVAAVEIGIALATAWTGVGAAAGVAARIAAQVAVKIAMKQLLTRMIARGIAKAAARAALRGAAFEALEEGGIDALARTIQVAKGDRTMDDFGWSDLGLATFGGAVGGAVGGSLGDKLGGVGDNITSGLGKLGAKSVAGAATELGADLSAQVATAGVASALMGQEFQLDIGVDTFTSAGAGGVQSGLESAAHGGGDNSGNSAAPNVPEVGDLGSDSPGSSANDGDGPGTSPASTGTPESGSPGGVTQPAGSPGGSTQPAGSGSPGGDGSPSTGSPAGTPGDGSNGASPSSGAPGGDSTGSGSPGDSGGGDTSPSASSPGDASPSPSSPNGSGAPADTSGGANPSTGSPDAAGNSNPAPAGPSTPTDSTPATPNDGGATNPGSPNNGTPTPSTPGDSSPSPANPSAPTDNGSTNPTSGTPSTDSPATQPTPGNTDTPTPAPTPSSNPSSLDLPPADSPTTTQPPITSPDQSGVPSATPTTASPTNGDQSPSPTNPTTGTPPSALGSPSTGAPVSAQSPADTTRQPQQGDPATNAAATTTAAPPGTAPLTTAPTNGTPTPATATAPSPPMTPLGAPINPASPQHSPANTPQPSTSVTPTTPAPGSRPNSPQPSTPSSPPSSTPTTPTTPPNTTRPGSPNTTNPNPGIAATNGTTATNGTPNGNGTPNALGTAGPDTNSAANAPGARVTNGTPTTTDPSGAQPNSPHPSTDPTPSTTPADTTASTTTTSAPRTDISPQALEAARQARQARESLRPLTPANNQALQVNPPTGRPYRSAEYPNAFNQPVRVVRLDVAVTGSPTTPPTTLDTVADNVQTATDLAFNQGNRFPLGDWLLVDTVPTTNPRTADLTIDADTTPTLTDLANSVRTHLGLSPRANPTLTPDDLNRIGSDISRADLTRSTTPSWADQHPSPNTNPDSTVTPTTDTNPEPTVDLDAIHNNHAEQTPAGISHHRGDPTMGDLPHRVPADPHRFTADTHITPDGHAVIGGQTLTPEQYGDLLRRSNWDGVTPIRLIGCDASTNGFADRLAQHLGVVVLAPTQAAWTDTNGNVFSASTVTNPDGTRTPRIPPDGQWQTHHPNGTNSINDTNPHAPGSRPGNLNAESAVSRAVRPGDRVNPTHNDIDWQAPPFDQTVNRVVQDGEPFYSIHRDPADNPTLEPRTRYEITDSTGRRTTVYTDGSNPPRITHIDTRVDNTRTGYPGNPVANPDASCPLPNVDYRVDTGDPEPFTFHTDASGHPQFELDTFGRPTGQDFEAGGENYRSIQDWNASSQPFSLRTDLEPNCRYEVFDENGDWHGDFYTGPADPETGQASFTHIETWTNNNPELGNASTMRRNDQRGPGDSLADGLPHTNTRYRVGDRVFHTDDVANGSTSFTPDYSPGGHPPRAGSVQARVGNAGEIDYPGQDFRGGHTHDHVAGSINEALGLITQLWRENNILLPTTDPLSRHNDSWRRSEMDRHNLHRAGHTLERVRVIPSNSSVGVTPDYVYWVVQETNPNSNRIVLHFRSHRNY
ncbi:hypothetical protein [Nocardia lasii]|uniref:Outer membrane channel protein CpnT-like N-terminal domain-containing protein n=1 Tax=Nocardia lasii TaxID=1616107 RepID=A0ABW1JRQ6_9NOCA